MMDHCTVTLVEPSTDTRLFALHEAETWSAMTLDAFKNCNESPELAFAATFMVRLTASRKTPEDPGVFVDINARCVKGDVAVKTNDVVCQLRLAKLLA